MRTHWLARPGPSGHFFKAATQRIIDQRLQADPSVATQVVESGRYIVIQC
jgi:hypothetical protein